MNAKVYIGNNVTIGSHCTLYSCHIEDDVRIGDKSVILEGARIEEGAQIAPGSVVPPGRLIPAKQLWAGNPVEYVKDLDIGEHWANYSYSYIVTALGDAHKAEFTMWPSNYLLKPSSKEDVELKEEDLQAQYITKNLYRTMVKTYA
jgi:carbonic anhydrase/acetyltransferase-like protein (isoleucine patch superfamily)